jgi:cold shock protein
MQGIVKNWSRTYGFVHGDDGKDYFTHYSCIAEDETGAHRSLEQGAHVSFDAVLDDPRGPRAINVKKLAAPAPTATTDHADAWR